MDLFLEDFTEQSLDEHVCQHAGPTLTGFCDQRNFFYINYLLSLGVFKQLKSTTDLFIFLYWLANFVTFGKMFLVQR